MIKREKIIKAVRGLEVDTSGNVFGKCQFMLMAQHDPLRVSGCPGCVDDRDGIVRCHLGEAAGFSSRVQGVEHCYRRRPSIRHRGSADDQMLDRSPLDDEPVLTDERSIRDEQFCSAIGENESHLRRRIFQSDRNFDRPRPGHGEPRHQKVDAIRKRDRNSVQLGDAQLDQPPRNPGHFGVELRIGGGNAIEMDKRIVAMRLGAMTQQTAQIARA